MIVFFVALLISPFFVHYLVNYVAGKVSEIKKKIEIRQSFEVLRARFVGLGILVAVLQIWIDYPLMVQVMVQVSTRYSYRTSFFPILFDFLSYFSGLGILIPCLGFLYYFIFTGLKQAESLRETGRILRRLWKLTLMTSILVLLIPLFELFDFYIPYSGLNSGYFIVVGILVYLSMELGKLLIAYNVLKPDLDSHKKIRDFDFNKVVSKIGDFDFNKVFSEFNLEKGNKNEASFDYNKPFSDFKLKKRGTWLNVILVGINTLVFTAFLGLWVVNGSSMNSGTAILAILGIMLVSILLSLINLLPTLISHTGWKYVIFIFNIFFGPTIIGWLILLLIANATNKSAKREQEMAYLLRKLSDKQ